MSELSIKIESVSKSYKDKKDVINQLNWNVPNGTIIGLLGKNGAGKSTLIKSILGLVKLEQGKISIFDETNSDLSPQVKSKIGYVPQDTNEYSWMKVWQLIKFRSAFYERWNEKKVQKLIQKWEISINTRVGNLSQGQRQKLSIICAIAHEPDLLLLDEPAAALDPVARKEFLKEMIDIAMDAKKTIIFSTHITSDIEKIADRVAILHQGKIALFDELHLIKEQIKKVLITSSSSLPQDMTLPNAVNAKNHGNSVSGIVNGIEDSWKQEMLAQGYKVDIKNVNLEDVFEGYTL